MEVTLKSKSIFMNLDKIKPFKSTRRDVERLFKFDTFIDSIEYKYPEYLFNEKEIEEAKNKNSAGYYTVVYQLTDGLFNATYSTGKCSKNNKHGYNLEKDTVINALLFLVNPIEISRFDFDLSKFEKVNRTSSSPVEDYISKDLGIIIINTDNQVSSVMLTPLPDQVEKYGCERLVTDAEMEKTFSDKREVFEKLLQMFDKDREVTAITSTITYPITEAVNNPVLVEKPVSFSKDRWNSYRELFRELKLKKGLLREDKKETEEIFLRTDYKDYGIGSADKGYIYTNNKVMPLVDSIDSILELLRNDDDKAKEFFSKEHAYYKKIADNWYLYFKYQ